MFVLHWRHNQDLLLFYDATRMLDWEPSHCDRVLDIWQSCGDCILTASVINQLRTLWHLCMYPAYD